MTLTTAGAGTHSTASPRTISKRSISLPSDAVRCSPSSCSVCFAMCPLRSTADPAARSLSQDGRGAMDLLLQLEDAVDQRLRGGRTARHVDIDRHDAVTAAD